MKEEIMEEEKRKAVVLIHGIGEQRPIETLRGFVKGIAHKLRKQKNETLFWEKPDPAYGNYETRKMTLLDHKDNSKTDFFEFYWAHRMRNTNFSHIRDWLKRVLFCSPSKVSKRLRSVFYFIWLLILLSILIIAYSVYTYGIADFYSRVATYISGAVSILILGFLSTYLYGFLGDAGRYLDPLPSNIAEREAIRREGVTLLQNLQDSGRYDRIVLIGHSLGSVIAYDLVKFLWNDNFKKYQEDSAINASENEEMNALLYASEEAAKKLNRGEISLDEFRSSQEKALRYYKAIGNGWKLTDLLTVGSPLTHAGYLFANGCDTFFDLKEHREYPTCPPCFQMTVDTNIEDSEETLSNGKKIKRYNHSSPFAITKWTNIYYSSDYIGGELASSFGKGIRDIELKRSKWCFLLPLGHTGYWDFKSGDNALEEIMKVLG